MREFVEDAVRMWAAYSIFGVIALAILAMVACGGGQVDATPTVDGTATPVEVVDYEQALEDANDYIIELEKRLAKQESQYRAPANAIEQIEAQAARNEASSDKRIAWLERELEQTQKQSKTNQRNYETWSSRSDREMNALRIELSETKADLREAKQSGHVSAMGKELAKLRLDLKACKVLAGLP